VTAAARKPSRKGADQRDRLMAAAIEAIAENGPDRVTVRDIASRAGISPSHVLYYFGRRDQILIETLRWSEAELAARRHAELRRFRAPARALRRFVELYLPAAAVDLRWNLWHQVIARPPAQPETVAMIRALEQGWVDDLAALVKDGQRKGVFGPVEPESFALRALLIMDGVASAIVLGVPGRTPSWGADLVESALLAELGVRRR
jgi:AcrR family transcriptional regulator